MAKSRNPSVISEELKDLYFQPIKTDDISAVQSLIDRGSGVVKEEDYLQWKECMKTVSLDGFGVFNPLTLAVEFKAYRTIELLLKNKANPNFKDAMCLPLIQAAKSNDTRATELLMVNGADVDLVIYEGGRKTNPIITATKKGSCEVLRILLRAEIDSDVIYQPRLFSLSEAIDIAVLNNNCEIAEVLLSHGADPNKTIRMDQRSLLDAARTYDKNEMALLLEKFGANKEKSEDVFKVFNIDSMMSSIAPYLGPKDINMLCAR